MRFSSNSHVHASRLDLFLTSLQDSCRAQQLCPHGNSDHAVVYMGISLCSPISHEPPIKGLSFCYHHTDQNDNLNHPVHKYDTEKAGIEHFIPTRKYDHLLGSRLPACPAALAYRNHFFRLYLSVRSDYNIRLFVIAHSECKPVLREAKLLFAGRM